MIESFVGCVAGLIVHTGMRKNQYKSLNNQYTNCTKKTRRTRTGGRISRRGAEGAEKANGFCLVRRGDESGKGSVSKGRGGAEAFTTKSPRHQGATNQRPTSNVQHSTVKEGRAEGIRRGREVGGGQGRVRVLETGRWQRAMADP